MTTASPATSGVIRAAGQRTSVLSDRTIGILVISLVPALIWMGLIAAGGWLIGADIPFYALAMCGLGIGLFLAAVGAAVTARS